MPDLKKIFILILIFKYSSCYSQELFPKENKNSGLFELSVEVGAGGSYYSTKPNVPLHLETDVSKISKAFSFRINWKTDHRLSISVESGLIEFYSYTMKGKNSEGDLKISAIPLLVEFAMPLTKKFQIRAGAGSYFQTTELNYLGKVRSNSVGLGWIAGGSYSLISKDNNSFNCELKWMDSAESQQAIMVLQLSYKYTFFRW